MKGPRLVSLFSLSQRRYPLTERVTQPLVIGERRLTLSTQGQFACFELSELSSDEVVQRGQFSAHLDELQLKPTLLDRPLVIALEGPLHVPPRGTCSLRLSRPLAFDLVVNSGEERLRLCSSSTRALRLTSYGQITHPMLCYHWVSAADVDQASGDEALVPITVRNQTKHPVELKKVIIYKSFLKLFRGEAQFVTNQVKVLITSKSEAYLEYAHAPLPELGPCELIFDPEHEGELPLLKILRLVSKRGTGIEYGF